MYTVCVLFATVVQRGSLLDGQSLHKYFKRKIKQTTKAKQRTRHSYSRPYFFKKITKQKKERKYREMKVVKIMIIKTPGTYNVAVLSRNAPRENSLTDHLPFLQYIHIILYVFRSKRHSDSCVTNRRYTYSGKVW